MISPSLDKVGTDLSNFIKIGAAAAPVVTEVAKKFYDVATQTQL